MVPRDQKQQRQPLIGHCYPDVSMTRLSRLLSHLLWLGLLSVAPAVQAAPDNSTGTAATTTTTDPVLQMLRDKGLLPSAAQVQQVRDSASELVMVAMNFMGVVYRHGGNSAEQGFDCSGFTRHIFERSLGLVLPRRAEQQAQHGALQAVQHSELKPGDLVFFNTMKRAFSHVGIYIGEGRFIHSPRVGGEVRIEDMRLAYWAQRFDGARRAEAATATATAPTAITPPPATP
jgi:cell wall-associated NlpC family hydrolase